MHWSFLDMVAGMCRQSPPFKNIYSHTHVHALMTRKGMGVCCDIPSFCLPCQPGRRFPPANAQQIHLLFISCKAEKACQTWQSYLPTSSPACADAIANVFPSAGDQYVWKQTNNSALPGRLFPFSRPPLGALTADVHSRINKQCFSRVNTGHNQQRRIYTAKDDQHSLYSMSYARDRHSAKLCLLPENKPQKRYRFSHKQRELLLKFKATGINIKVYTNTKLERCTVWCPGNA